jgi:TPR repeat protein
MPQAEYVVGLEYTDDLVVKRDWGKAYLWIKKSASEGFAPAKKTLTDLVKYVDFSNVDTTQSLTENVSAQTIKTTKNSTPNNNFNNSSLSSSLGLVFIDFGSKRDTSLHFSNQLLINDLLHDGNEKLDSVLHITEAKDTSLKIDSSNSKVLLQFADAGSPEALTILGRFYETGYYFPKDLLSAAVCYVQATRLDSPRSPYLLWEISRKTNFYNELKNLVEANDPRAMFIWYGLYLIKFDNQFTAEDAIKLLEHSASLNYIPALNELGLDYYTGRFVKQNKKKAITIWNNAEKMGSTEAKLRLAIATIYDATDNSGYAKAVKEILDSVDKGSVLAQATLAYCYQFGFGIEQSIPEAVRFYRMAAQRGSSFAYSQLKQLYNSVRPSDPMFNLN